MKSSRSLRLTRWQLPGALPAYESVAEKNVDDAGEAGELAFVNRFTPAFHLDCDAGRTVDLRENALDAGRVVLTRAGKDDASLGDLDVDREDVFQIRRRDEIQYASAA
jgi:hypothetical protein